MIVIGQFSCTKSTGKMVSKCHGSAWPQANYKNREWRTRALDEFCQKLKQLCSPMQVPLQANGRAPLFPQSNPLSHVNLMVSFAWFWPSSSVDNPKTRAAIPRFLRKFSASTILFALMTQNTPLTNRNVEFSKWAATRNIKICCMISWERRW